MNRYLKCAKMKTLQTKLPKKKKRIKEEEEEVE
jgi:hypothetical protein